MHRCTFCFYPCKTFDMQKEKTSVVIICKNSARTIERTIGSALALTSDVIVADTGSTDGTIEKITSTSARLAQLEWNGYGITKNTANTLAANDWILSLDADEYIDGKLITSIREAELRNNNIVCTMKRLNYLGEKPIHFGEWGHDIVTRLFNRTNAVWDVSPVHESLVTTGPAVKVHLQGTLHHFTSPNIQIYKLKLEKYAQLMAEKYHEKGEKAYWYKLYLSPVANFMQNYIFKGGFLDGKEGFQIARVHSWYSYRKYALLKSKIKQRDA